jgi:hypothetical protein
MFDCKAAGAWRGLVQGVREAGGKMNFSEALEHKAQIKREPKSVLESIQLKKADNGGVVANHRMTRFDGKEPVHAFGAEDGHLLAAHIEKHLGIKMTETKGKQSEEPEVEANEE